jgi:hypothetical protein
MTGHPCVNGLLLFSVVRPELGREVLHGPRLQPISPQAPFEIGQGGLDLGVLAPDDRRLVWGIALEARQESTPFIFEM